MTIPAAPQTSQQRGNVPTAATEPARESGVWCVWADGNNGEPAPIAVHPTAETAAVAAAALGSWTSIAYWPFGVEFQAAVTAFASEGRPQ